MSFDVEISDRALDNLKAIREYDRRQIVDTIYEQLEHQPATVTRNRKCLKGAVPDFDHVPPLWEPRIEDYRIFYDVDGDSQTVYVRAVRRKEQGQTTGDIIHERSDP